ncbi:MAG: Gfo/Idh/MocA family protein [Actinomycetes bacterium]
MAQLAWVLGILTAHEEGVRGAVQRSLESGGWTFTTDVDRAEALLVWSRDRLSVSEESLLATIASERRPMVLMGATVTADLPVLREASGVVPRAWIPPHPARLRADGQGPWAQRVDPCDEELEVTTSVMTVEKVRESVETWVSAPIGLSREPVVTWNPDTAVAMFTPVPTAPLPADSADVIAIARMLHLSLRRMLDIDSESVLSPIRVGLLGFGAIGAEHARAAQQLPGLSLDVVCDRNSERLHELKTLSPSVHTTRDATELLEGEVDLVVISTPPDTHADWAIKALSAGKHVVVEKPLSITSEEADAVMVAARAAGRRVVTYQNRRFDSDFLAVRRTVQSGQIGDVFHTETFIGGYGHPCNYWHSDADVSGGAIYDWGSHVLDQVLALHAGSIEHVSCLEHKRRWFDVTNADHSSLQIRFSDGTEASFIHSDLAAALKPRWYLLGTEGALVSRWRSASVISRNEIGTLSEDRLAVTDSPPDVYRLDADGSETAVVPPGVGQHPFHRQLVDDLLYDWPMTVTAEQSRRVVAVMEAARASAHSRGQAVRVNGEV